MSDRDAALDQWRPGLFHRPNKDMLEVRLSQQPPPRPISAVSAQDPRGVVQVQLRRGSDGRLYSLLVARASACVPAGVLQGQAGTVPGPGPVSDNADEWFVPLFDGADLVARTRVVLRDGTARPAVSAMLAASGRLAGFLVSDVTAQLPDSVLRA